MNNYAKRYPAGFRLQAICTVLLAVICAFAKPAFAAQGSVAFGGTVGLNNSCQIVISSPDGGTLAASPDLMELSSKQVGGNAGTAEVRTTNSVSYTHLTLPTIYSV